MTTVLAACDAFVSANGQVTDTGGRPLSNVVVWLAWGARTESTATDSLGRFSVAFSHGVGTKPGYVAACKAGYVAERVTFTASNTALDGLTFRLAPGRGDDGLCP